MFKLWPFPYVRPEEGQSTSSGGTGFRGFGKESNSQRNLISDESLIKPKLNYTIDMTGTQVHCVLQGNCEWFSGWNLSGSTGRHLLFHGRWQHDGSGANSPSKYSDRSFKVISAISNILGNMFFL